MPRRRASSPKASEIGSHTNNYHLACADRQCAEDLREPNCCYPPSVELGIKTGERRNREPWGILRQLISGHQIPGPQDVLPWPAPQGCDVVILPVPDVSDLLPLLPRHRRELVKEPRIRLSDPPLIRRSEHISRQIQFPQEPPRPLRLVPRPPPEVPAPPQRRETRPRIRVKIEPVEDLPDPRVQPCLPFPFQVKPRPEVLEHLPVIPAPPYHR